MSRRDAPQARRALRLPELVACLVAATGVADTWFQLWLAPVAWAALLLAGALALAALRSRTAHDQGVPAWAEHHAAVGLLLIAVLVIASVPVGTAPTPAQSGHEHGTSLAPGAVAAIASVAAVGFAVLTVFTLARLRHWGARAPVIAMGVIVLLMASSVVG